MTFMKFTESLGLFISLHSSSKSGLLAFRKLNHIVYLYSSSLFALRRQATRIISDIYLAIILKKQKK